MKPPLPRGASADELAARYLEVKTSLAALLEGEDDWVAAMATVVGELHNSFEGYDWTGIYRAVTPELLVVGPYQGGHGCLRIPIEKGVCGAAARTRTTQVVRDVEAFEGHIACSTSTRSEIVVPILAPDGDVLGVLDVDSDDPDAFGDVDRVHLEGIARDLGVRFAATTVR